MRLIKIISFITLLLLGGFSEAQEVISTPERTPEQEATRQTERLTKELNLTPVQAKKVYEINLKYARERQISNSRAQAIERSKNKDAELKRILTENQSALLNDKRYEQGNNQTPGVTPNGASSFKSGTTYRTNPTQPTRVPVDRNTYRAEYDNNYSRPANSSNRTYTPSTTQRSASPAATPSGSSYRAVPKSSSEGSSPNRNYNDNRSSTTVTPTKPSENRSRK